MSVEPLKSALSIGNVDDTSLALPSGPHGRSGQQRVLEQVQTIRRSRSKKSSSSSSRSASMSLSPTSPPYDSIFSEALKSPTSPTNGFLFFSKSITQEKNAVVGSKKTASSTHLYSSGHAALGQTLNGRGVSDQRSAPPQRLPSNLSAHRASVNGTGRSHADGRVPADQVDGAKAPPESPVNGAPKTQAASGGAADITMKEAVEYLSHQDETYQHCGASYIQHNAFIDDKAKEEVLRLNGIHPLVALLRGSSPRVSQTASAALRNLSFRSDGNKERVHRSGGVTEAAALLRDADSAETQKQLTGLLWNLSSVDSLKPDLLKSALPVLMERVILPYTTGPDRTGSQDQDEVFFNATGCLRNLSSTKQSNRQALRKCPGLVDSLVAHVRERVDAGTPDDKSVENCVCTLHNLTFQLEAEAPALFSRIAALAQDANRGPPGKADAGPIGCFGPQSKPPGHERRFDFPVVEDPQPSGAGWLIHSKTMQSYLSVLETSQREETQEACCGALQNLTAQDSTVSSVMSHTIVQKLNGLRVICPLVKSEKVNIQKSAVALLGNLTKNPNLTNAIARKALPNLLDVLSAGTEKGNESDDTLAMACQTSNGLLMNQPEMGKRLLNNKLIDSLKDLSQIGYLPKSSKAAALLLRNMWSEKDLQSALKKQGMSKASFVNDITAAALKPT
ncbi:plakophilin-1 [Pungitius pungitius]|uniref:plakophilin-1 n=1 Tax=Pungitius pungitius TaxID=134920 RepID=UPI002E10116B